AGGVVGAVEIDDDLVALPFHGHVATDLVRLAAGRRVAEVRVEVIRCEAGLDEPHERETARGAIELEAQPAGALRGTRGGRGGRDLDPAHVALEPAAYAKTSIHGEPP